MLLIAGQASLLGLFRIELLASFDPVFLGKHGFFDRSTSRTIPSDPPSATATATASTASRCAFGSLRNTRTMESGEFRTTGIEATLYGEDKQVKQVLPVAMRKAPRLNILSGFIQINQDSIFFLGVLFNTLLRLLFFNWTWDERVHENREVGDGGSRVLAVKPAPSTVESFTFGLPFMYGAKVEDDLDGRLGVFFPTPVEEPIIILDIGSLGKAVERIKSG